MKTFQSVFSSCPHAHLVYNKYTGESVMVPCHNCLYCKMQESIIMAARIRSEAAQHNFNIFFTLTYNNNYVPYAQRLDTYLETCGIADIDDITSLRNTLYPNIPAKHLYIQVVSPGNYRLSSAVSGYLGEDCLPAAPKEFDVVDSIAVLSKSDIQKFYKRLRYYIDYDPDNLLFNVPKEERHFRYYICGEYGPTTFRPHYHGIVFCDSFQVSSAIRSCYIYKAWSFCVQGKSERESIGKVDVQYARDAAGYVSSYVSSFYSLPRILANGCFKPFRLYSKSPTLGVSETEIKKVFDSITRGFVTEIQQSVNKEGRVTSDVRLFSRSLISWLFPRCTNFRGYKKDSATLAAIYFPCFEKFSRKEDLKFSKFHYNPVRLNKDGDEGWFDETNVHCARRARLVCDMFHLAYVDYIDLLVKCYSLMEQYSLNESLRRFEEYSSLCSSSDFKRTLHSFFQEDVDISLLPFLPQKLPYTSIQLTKCSSEQCLLCDARFFDLKDNKINLSDYSVSIAKFDDIPRFVRDIFCIPDKDIDLLRMFYYRDDDGLSYTLDVGFVRQIYDPETQCLVAAQRMSVRDLFKRKLLQKKINQNQQACAALNKCPLD